MLTILKYEDWKDTAYVLHSISQMMGKVKLARMPSQPEWGQVVLLLTPQGFSTGLIPNGEKSFSIVLNFDTATVFAQTVSGETSGFSLRNHTSVSEYYRDFHHMLTMLACDTEISPVPQETPTQIPFPEDTAKYDYDNDAARAFFAMAVFAYGQLLDFVSPFRGKKLLPSFFWGTFDLSAILFSGMPCPFDGKGIIEENAFDERFVEFGFWPGDPANADPSFYVLPYPFLKSIGTQTKARPDKAAYSAQKSEYFLTLAAALSYREPQRAIQDFFGSVFHGVVKSEEWKDLAWLTKALPRSLKK
ncbi:MAG: DUF5996 family protein [Christensenella sp.]|nr:DUF5996 family protein [Christensenella sp.]